MISVHPIDCRASRSAPRRRPASIAALTAAIIVILVASPQAQQPTAFAGSSSNAGPAPALAVPTEIDLLVGRSTVLNLGTAIARVSLTVPDIADALVTAPGQILIHGKQPGTISLFVWDRGGSITTYEVKVRRDLTPLVNHLKQLFPGEPIEVRGSGKDVVVSGTVSSKYVVEKAADVAAGYVEKKENVVNLLKQQEGVASNQVMLRVRFAEVSRNALQELGATFFAHGYRSEWFGRTAPPGIPAPDFDNDEGLVFSDFLNLFVLNAKEGLGGAVRALQNKGLFQSLAEPNLIASSGKEASFLAGGEYPYPVAQPTGSGTSFTIMFKEFGVRLNFTPTVLGGDLIHVKVRPEVSALDFANAITLEGFRIPALTTRRTETEVELRDGQTFAIAGLMNNTLTSSMSKIPGIGDIPVLGLLFRSRAHQKNQTELVVMITPHIIRRGQSGVSEGLPSLVEPYLGRPDRTYPNPDPYQGSPRYPATRPAPQEGAGSVGPAPSQAAAPASTLQPQTGVVVAQPVASDRAAQPPVVRQPAQPVAAVPVAPAAKVIESKPVRSQAEPKVAAPTKEELRALQRAREAERKAAEAQHREQQAAEKRRAEQARKDDERRRQAEKLEAERQKREAAVAEKKAAEEARRQKEEDEKREKLLSEAELRLKQAQEAYEQAVAKSGGKTGGSK